MLQNMLRIMLSSLRPFRSFAKWSGKHFCQSLFLINLLIFFSSFNNNFIKNKVLAQVFPCEFCEISKNTFLQNASGWLLPKVIKGINSLSSV